jgi:hypothetical protein
MNSDCTVRSRGGRPLITGVEAPELLVFGRMTLWVFPLALATAACGSQPEQSTYDPVALGMAQTDPPLYDDQETTIYQSSRPVSLPIAAPSEADLQLLAMTQPTPYDHLPWITKDDVKVQIGWTLSNLDSEARNIEILIDPWNEFVRYVPGVNMGEESTVPNLSGIDLLIRVDGMGRKSGTFTFDDMDELATDLATVQNILAAFPPVAIPAGMPPAAGTGPNVNGMINHAFELHNRSSDGDVLIGAYIPARVAGLVGFDLSLRSYAPAKVAIEIVVEVADLAGNRVDAKAPLKIDGSMWLSPEQTISVPGAAVR